MLDREYQGAFPKMSDVERVARIIWLRYLIETEEFDRTLPGAWNHLAPDEWMPYDMATSRSFSYRRSEIARRECDVNWISRSTWEPIRRSLDMWSLKRWRVELDALLRAKG